jgi:hypothetical protein
MYVLMFGCALYFPVPLTQKQAISGVALFCLVEITARLNSVLAVAENEQEKANFRFAVKIQDVRAHTTEKCAVCF